jgi:O-antigen ligase
MNIIQYEEAPTIGFQGKEKLGSARGYIWSRSLPILLHSLFIGQGPDTFFAVFPQGDLLGKLYAYNTTQMIVDKPHNLYLQISINEGGIALIAFLVMMLAYCIDSFKLYALRKEYNVQQAIGAAIALAIIGYLGAGFFNDSIVSVAPIFWVLFGTGIAVNLHNKKQTQTEPEA